MNCYVPNNAVVFVQFTVLSNSLKDKLTKLSSATEHITVFAHYTGYNILVLYALSLVYDIKSFRFIHRKHVIIFVVR